jgi:tetratricopeptide (TPR) repeat protein
MPVQAVLVLASLMAILGITVRRGHLNYRSGKIQNELKVAQRKQERELSKIKSSKSRMEAAVRVRETEKKVSRDNVVKITELMRKVEHLMESDQQEEALKILIQVTALDRDHRNANEKLASLYLKRNQNQKAELIYHTLIETFPQDSVYYSNLGHTYFNRRKFKKAIPLYERALELDKGNPMRYINLGHVYVTKKDYAEAIEYYKKANRLNTRDTELMFLIVEVALESSNPILAREYLLKILDYEPYNQRAKELLSEVLDLLKEGERV